MIFPLLIYKYNQLSSSQPINKKVFLDITSQINRLSNNEKNNTTLNVNDTFKDWKTIKIAINIYMKQNGFVAIKYHKDLNTIDKTITRHHIYSYWKVKINNSKKIEDISLHHDDILNKTSYPW